MGNFARYLWVDRFLTSAVNGVTFIRAMLPTFRRSFSGAAVRFKYIALCAERRNGQGGGERRDPAYKVAITLRK